MVSWIVGKLKFLFIIAAVGGPIMAYLVWADADRIRTIQEKGIETRAAVTGGTIRRKRGRVVGYRLKLSWNDTKGSVRTADSVSVSKSFGERIVSNGKLRISSVPIKYLADKEDVTPLVIPDMANQQQSDKAMIPVGITAGLVGVIGSFAFFFFGRRRRTRPEAAAQQT